MKVQSVFIVALMLTWATARADSAVTLSIHPESPGFAIPSDFTGLSFETGSELPNRNGVAGYLFCPTNAQLITLFQNSGIHNLRLGGGSVDIARVRIPGPADIKQVFGFAKRVGQLKVIYSLRLLNGDPGNDSLGPGDAYLADYIWKHFRPLLASFSIGNEPDWKSYHRPDPNIQDYPSYLAAWRRFAAAIRSSVPKASFAGPDTGSYTTSTFYQDASWTEHFARDERASRMLACVTQHYYVGDKPGSRSAPEAIEAMLSPDWVTNHYAWLYHHILAQVAAQKLPFRLTESNDYLTGVASASNAFASALWALDFLHWWAASGCAGVNFHNKAWLYTDTVFLDSNKQYQVNPKAYALKAFELGSHGRVVPVVSCGGSNLNLTAYGVLGTNALFVTIINKEHGANAREANVTIVPGGLFEAAAVMFLAAADAEAGAMSGITLGGAPITNHAPWQGRWKVLPEARNGRFRLAVPPVSAAIVRLSRSNSVTPGVWNP